MQRFRVQNELLICEYISNLQDDLFEVTNCQSSKYHPCFHLVHIGQAFWAYDYTGQLSPGYLFDPAVCFYCGAIIELRLSAFPVKGDLYYSLHIMIW